MLPHARTTSGRCRGLRNQCVSLTRLCLQLKRIIFLVLSLDSSLNDVKMRLAGIYEVLHEPRKALDLVYQGTPWTNFLNEYCISDAFQSLIHERDAQKIL